MMTVVDYLNVMFAAMEENDTSSLKKLCRVASCSSHLTKMILTDVRQSFSKKNIQNIVMDFTTEILSISSLQEMDHYIMDLLVIFKKSKRDEEYLTSLQRVQK